jgi:hypothetical protein
MLQSGVKKSREFALHHNNQPIGSAKHVVRSLDVRFVIRPSVIVNLDCTGILWDIGNPVVAITPRSPRTRMFIMPMPYSEVVCLTDPQRVQLEALVRAGSTPQALALRCRLVLRAAAEDHPCNLQIAAEFQCDRHTVAVWRSRFLKMGLAGLQDAPRSGRRMALA